MSNGLILLLSVNYELSHFTIKLLLGGILEAPYITARL